MTKILFFRDNGVFYGFEEQGHTGYADAGDDILCAAVSSMTMLIVNTIEVAYGSEVAYSINEDDTKIVVRSKGALPQYEEDERKRFAISGLFMGYCCQLKELAEEQYGDFLKIDVIDRNYDDADPDSRA